LHTDMTEKMTLFDYLITILYKRYVIMCTELSILYNIQLCSDKWL